MRACTGTRRSRRPAKRTGGALAGEPPGQPAAEWPFVDTRPPPPPQEIVAAQTGWRQGRRRRHEHGPCAGPTARPCARRRARCMHPQPAASLARAARRATRPAAAEKSRAGRPQQPVFSRNQTRRAGTGGGRGARGGGGGGGGVGSTWTSDHRSMCPSGAVGCMGPCVRRGSCVGGCQAAGGCSARGPFFPAGPLLRLAALFPNLRPPHGKPAPPSRGGARRRLLDRLSKLLVSP